MEEDDLNGSLGGTRCGTKGARIFLKMTRWILSLKELTVQLRSFAKIPKRFTLFTRSEWLTEPLSYCNQYKWVLWFSRKDFITMNFRSNNIIRGWTTFQESAMKWIVNHQKCCKWEARILSMNFNVADNLEIPLQLLPLDFWPLNKRKMMMLS